MHLTQYAQSRSWMCLIYMQSEELRCNKTSEINRNTKVDKRKAEKIISLGQNHQEALNPLVLANWKQGQEVLVE